MFVSRLLAGVRVLFFVYCCHTDINLSKNCILTNFSLRTADAFPLVASLPPIFRREREATTGNASAVRRLDKLQFIVNHWGKFCGDWTGIKSLLTIEKHRYGVQKTVSKHLKPGNCPGTSLSSKY